MLHTIQNLGKSFLFSNPPQRRQEVPKGISIFRKLEFHYFYALTSIFRSICMQSQHIFYGYKSYAKMKCGKNLKNTTNLKKKPRHLHGFFRGFIVEKFLVSQVWPSLSAFKVGHKLQLYIRERSMRYFLSQLLHMYFNQTNVLQ